MGNDGTGGFEELARDGAREQRAFDVLDLTGDGLPELFFVSRWVEPWESSFVLVNPRTPDLWFTVPTWNVDEGILTDVVVGDFDHDGRGEAVVFEAVEGGTQVWLGEAARDGAIFLAWTFTAGELLDGEVHVYADRRFDLDGQPAMVVHGDRGPGLMRIERDVDTWAPSLSFFDDAVTSADFAGLARTGGGGLALVVDSPDEASLVEVPLVPTTGVVRGVGLGPVGRVQPGVPERAFDGVTISLWPGSSPAAAVTEVALTGQLGDAPLDGLALADALSVRVDRFAVDGDGRRTRVDQTPAAMRAEGDRLVVELPALPVEPPGADRAYVADLYVTLERSFFAGPPDDLTLALAPVEGGVTTWGSDAQAWATSFAFEGTTAMGVGNTLPVLPEVVAEVEAGASVDIDALAGATDADGDALAVTRVVAPPSAGDVEIIDAATVRYISDGTPSVDDAFIVEVADGASESWAIVVVAVGDIPVPWARDVYAAVDTDEEVAIELVGGGGLGLEGFSIATRPDHGRTFWVDEAAGVIGYRADPRYVGADRFTYTATDGDATSEPATVWLSVRRITPDDEDGDGVPDDVDNCPDDFNDDQDDLDGDGWGDACDRDVDGDGVVDRVDLCPRMPGVHVDTDEDGLGDVCDPDDDDDGVLDDDDVCPLDEDPDQLDLDDDGVGDVCDDDDDGDYVDDADDLCPLVADRAQVDTDDDGVGDACDDDDDGDDVPDVDDVCPFTVDPDQLDTDADGVGDACDGDRDEDGALTEDDCDDLDPSVFDVATFYADGDEDGFGDPDDTVEVCAVFAPEGYVVDSTDNCPDVANPGQRDGDDDGVGDACDDDPGADVGGDAGMDAGSDAGGDAGLDVGSDASGDVGSDVGSDAGGDVGADASGDASVDATTDTSGDTRTDGDGILGDASADGANDDAGADGDARSGGGGGGCAAAPGGGDVPLALVVWGLAFGRTRRRRV